MTSLQTKNNTVSYLPGLITGDVSRSAGKNTNFDIQMLEFT